MDQGPDTFSTTEVTSFSSVHSSTSQLGYLKQISQYQGLPFLNNRDSGKKSFIRLGFATSFVMIIFPNASLVIIPLPVFIILSAKTVTRS